MSSLTVYHQSSPEAPNKLLTHAEDIASTLAAVGVQFVQLPVAVPVRAGSAVDEVVAACRTQLDQLMSERGFASFDVLSLCSEPRYQDGPRTSLPSAQRYGVAHLHYCLAGRGLLCLHIDDYVYAVQCEKNDLVQLPAATLHWFDSGEQPRITLLRLFDSDQLPVAEPADDALVASIAGLDDC
ncbi:acireductone dioxygenase [Pseudomonas sp. EA_105y_Pfl2_R69]|uniref:acireductone dioxygenase n=1 Tax=Pseudomonas sp. EA_105y_Pfl2_R69 TaxID=3088683 RepID=UPI0030DA4DDF